MITILENLCEDYIFFIAVQVTISLNLYFFQHAIYQPNTVRNTKMISENGFYCDFL